MKPEGTLLLTRADVQQLLDLGDCIAAVESAFALRGEGKARPPGTLGFPYAEGGFHIKAAGMDLARPYFAVKINGNFSENPRRRQMPAIQGVIALCDADNGFPLALLDSIAITVARTGAATAVAAKYLARPESAAATICGCGNQGRVQLAALARVLPLRRAEVFDEDPASARSLAADMSEKIGIEVTASDDLARSLRSCDVAVTCTPSRRPLVRPEDLAPGTFLAAVGADSPDKQELEPSVLASSRVVVDVLDQCAEFGELHHALEARVMRREDVWAELSEIVAGKKPGRQSASEVVVFDSTGTALQDVAAAALVFERAERAGIGLRLRLAG